MDTKAYELELYDTPSGTAAWRITEAATGRVYAEGIESDMDALAVQAELNEAAAKNPGAVLVPECPAPTAPAYGDAGEVYFTCPEHGDVAIYSPQDYEAHCVDRDEVLDLDHPEVKAALMAAEAELAERRLAVAQTAQALEAGRRDVDAEHDAALAPALADEMAAGEDFDRIVAEANRLHIAPFTVTPDEDEYLDALLTRIKTGLDAALARQAELANLLDAVEASVGLGEEA